MKILDLLIIGAGPAGLGAGIQAARLGMDHAVIERKEAQSRLLLARKVENFPLAGDSGLPGPELYCSLLAQSQKSGANIVTGFISSIVKDKGIFIIVAGQNPYKAKAIILATGLLPKKISGKMVPQELEGKKLFYRWTDIPRVTPREGVLVIGGGEVAFDQACSLAENGFNVTIAIRGKGDKTFEFLRREARALGISLIYNTRISRISEAKEGIKASMKTADRKIERHYDRCLAAIGSCQGTSLISGKPFRGIFTAGDLAHPRQKQAAIAFGDGIKKTMEAYEYIRDNGK